MTWNRRPAPVDAQRMEKVGSAVRTNRPNTRSAQRTLHIYENPRHSYSPSFQRRTSSRSAQNQPRRRAQNQGAQKVATMIRQVPRNIKPLGSAVWNASVSPKKFIPKKPA